MSRYNRVKYMNTPNLDRADDNRYQLSLGDICHIAGSYVRANQYNYCGYQEFDVPRGSRVRVIGIKQTDLNSWDGSPGDVYLDLELVDHRNVDGTPMRLGNRHAFCLREVCEASVKSLES